MPDLLIWARPIPAGRDLKAHKRFNWLIYIQRPPLITRVRPSSALIPTASTQQIAAPAWDHQAVALRSECAESAILGAAGWPEMVYLSRRALEGLKAYEYKPSGYTYLDAVHTPFWECELRAREGLGGRDAA